SCKIPGTFKAKLGADRRAPCGRLGKQQKMDGEGSPCRAGQTTEIHLAEGDRNHMRRVPALMACWMMIGGSLAMAGDPALSGNHPLTQSQAGDLLISELRCAAC